MYCPYCGNLLGDSDNYCSSCGRRRPVLLEPLDSVRSVFEGALAAPSQAAGDSGLASGDAPTGESAKQAEGAMEPLGDVRPADGSGVAADAPAQGGQDTAEPADESGGAPAPPAEDAGAGAQAAPDAAAAPAEAADLDEPHDLDEPSDEAAEGPGAPDEGLQRPGPQAAPGAAAPAAPAMSPPSPETAPAPAVRRAAPFIAAQVPDPEEPPSPPARPAYLPWGTPATAACMVAACCLAALCALAVVLAPLFEFPALPSVEGAPADAMAAALASADARLSAFIGGLLGAGGVGAWEAARAAAAACDALQDRALAVEIGLACGLVALAVCALVAGAVSSLALRRSTPLLIWGSLYSCAVLAALAAGAAWLGDAAVSEMRSAASEAFADMGAQMPAAFQVLAPAPALVAAAAAAAAAFALAAGSRRSWKAEHPAWRH